jgi:periplasmic divalent cation tolerance protein
MTPQERKLFMQQSINTTIFLVYITVPDQECAHRIAHTLVVERLAAGVNIAPLSASLYWWQGAVQTSAEYALIAQCTQQGFEALRARVCALHPYEVPCIVGLPLAAGHSPFLRWVEREAQPAQDGGEF